MEPFHAVFYCLQRIFQGIAYFRIKLGWFLLLPSCRSNGCAVVGEGGVGEDDEYCMKSKEVNHMRTFIPSNPQDPNRSQIEIMNWQAELEAEKRRERRETRRFIITTVVSGIAAVAAMSGVLIQLLSK